MESYEGGTIEYNNIDKASNNIGVNGVWWLMKSNWTKISLISMRKSIIK
jgi:hypothetical protein